jgi:hypothetical protein
MDGGELLEVGAGELEEGCGGGGPALLEVDEGAGELNQSFVKEIIGLLAAGEPKFFQDFVRFIKHLAVAAFEKTKVMGVQVLAAAVLDEGRDFGGFVAH